MLTSSRDGAQYYQFDYVEADDLVSSIFYGAGEFVKITKTLHISSDPKDDMFVETAIVAGAHVPVAEDVISMSPPW